MKEKKAAFIRFKINLRQTSSLYVIRIYVMCLFICLELFLGELIACDMCVFAHPKGSAKVKFGAANTILRSQNIVSIQKNP